MCCAVLALNKADLPTASKHIEEVKRLYPGELCMPVSAHTEMQLCKWRRAGLIEYEQFSGRAKVGYALKYMQVQFWVILARQCMAFRPGLESLCLEHSTY